MPTVALPQGTIHYAETGAGRPVVFVHGYLMGGELWQRLASELAPLGSHQVALRRDADLSPTGLARLIADFLDALDLQDVTLVGNDTGGALCQLVVTRHPERIGRLVLTNCDAFENFPPRAFRPLIWAARARLLTALIQTMRLRLLQRAPLAYGWLSARPLPDAVLDEWLAPFLQDRGVRRDTRRAFAGMDPALLLDAAAALASFDRPVLIAWARDDRFFPLDHAHRLAAILPDARVEEIADARTFVSWDQPERLADLVADFALSERAGAPA